MVATYERGVANLTINATEKGFGYLRWKLW